MAVCTAQELIEARKRHAHTNLACREPMPAGVNTVEAAEKALRSAFEDVLARRMPEKGNRPWQLVDIGAKLDPAQSWLGFEYEMGLRSQADYNALVTYIWHEHNHVAIDREGIGEWSAEITFPPENANTFREGQAGIQRLLRWMNERGIQTLGNQGRNIGQHLNVSAPGVRDAASSRRVSRLINHSMWLMAERKHVELFGRLPYGMSRSRNANNRYYLEFKLFNATQNQERFQQYVEVSLRMAELMQTVARLPVPADVLGQTTYIAGFYEILTGRRAAADVALAETNRADAMNTVGELSGWRYRNGLSGLDLA